MNPLYKFLWGLSLFLNVNVLAAQSAIFAQAAAFFPTDTLEGSPPTVAYHSLSIISTGRTAVLHWATKQENNNAGFEIQYRRQGHWQKVGFQAGAKSSRHLCFYSFSTALLPAGLHEFRLRQWSTDGTISCTAPLRVRIYDRSLGWELLVTHTEHIVKMVLNSDYSEGFLLSLFDDYGQVIYQQQLRKPAGNHQINIDLTAVDGKAHHWQLHNERGSWHQELRR